MDKLDHGRFCGSRKRLDIQHHLVGVAHRIETDDTEAHAAVGRSVVHHIDELDSGVLQFGEVNLTEGGAAVEDEHHHHHAVGLELLLGIFDLAVALPFVLFAVILPFPELESLCKATGIVGLGFLKSERDGLVVFHMAHNLIHRSKGNALGGDVGQGIDELVVVAATDFIVALDIVFGILGLCKSSYTRHHSDYDTK